MLGCCRPGSSRTESALSPRRGRERWPVSCRSRSRTPPRKRRHDVACGQRRRALPVSPLAGSARSGRCRQGLRSRPRIRLPRDRRQPLATRSPERPGGAKQTARLSCPSRDPIALPSRPPRPARFGARESRWPTGDCAGVATRQTTEPCPGRLPKETRTGRLRTLRAQPPTGRPAQATNVSSCKKAVASGGCRSTSRETRAAKAVWSGPGAADASHRFGTRRRPATACSLLMGRVVALRALVVGREDARNGAPLFMGLFAGPAHPAYLSA